MKLWFKKLPVPASNEIKEIDAVQTWEVLWTSRKGPYHSDQLPAMEVFISEQEALDFKKAIQNAFSLLKYKGDGTEVKMRKRQ